MSATVASRMSRHSRPIRFALVSLLVVGLAGIVAATAAALAFDDAAPCHDAQPVFACPDGTVGSSYSIQFVGRGGCGPSLPYQYRVLNGALPPGLSLSTSGAISGTPLQSGDYSFWAEISDQDPPSQSWCNPPQKAEREFRINIHAQDDEVVRQVATQIIPPELLALPDAGTDPACAPQGLCYALVPA